MSRVHLLPLLLALGLGVARADDADDVGGTYVVRAGRVFARLNASPGPRACLLADGSLGRGGARACVRVCVWWWWW